MGFALPRFIPAIPTTGTDQYLVVGIEGMDCIVIDQDGDMRPVAMADIRTKITYLADLEVWYSSQVELDELELAEETPGEESSRAGDGNPVDVDRGVSIGPDS